MEIIEQASRYVAKLPESISGDGGHNALFRAACVCVQGFDLDDDDALEILEEFNQRCEPEWSTRELIHKIESARRTYHRKEPGYLIKNQPKILGKINIANFIN